jgi:hypothetical protein
MAFAINAALIENGSKDYVFKPIEKEKINKHNLDHIFGKEIKKNKNQESDLNILDIHKNLKEENENELYNFYDTMTEKKPKVNLSEVTNDYMLLENSMEKKLPVNSLDNKINYILEILDQQKEIRSDQKNEEIILFFFLGIFIIYVLDKFASIGKYSR